MNFNLSDNSFSYNYIILVNYSNNRKFDCWFHTGDDKSSLESYFVNKFNCSRNCNLKFCCDFGQPGGGDVVGLVFMFVAV